MPPARSPSAPSAGRSRAPSPSRAAPRPRPRSWSSELNDGRTSGAANACPMRAMARPSRASRRRSRRCAGARDRARPRRRCRRRCRRAPRATRSIARFWDLEAKRAGKPVLSSPGSPAPRPLTTAFTISLGTPETMAAAARKARGAQAPEGQARRRGRSGAHRGGARGGAAGRADRRRQRRLDRRTISRTILPPAPTAGVTLVEQPLPAGDDAALARDHAADRRSAPTRACTTAPRSSARRHVRRGQHQARQDRRADRGAGHGRRGRSALGFDIMVGCMVATSLAMAPAVLVAQQRRASSISTGRCCSRATARTACATRQPRLSADAALVGLALA